MEFSNHATESIFSQLARIFPTFWNAFATNSLSIGITRPCIFSLEFLPHQDGTSSRMNLASRVIHFFQRVRPHSKQSTRGRRQKRKPPRDQTQKTQPCRLLPQKLPRPERPVPLGNRSRPKSQKRRVPTTSGESLSRRISWTSHATKSRRANKDENCKKRNNVTGTKCCWPATRGTTKSRVL